MLDPAAVFTLLSSVPAIVMLHVPLSPNASVQINLPVNAMEPPGSNVSVSAPASEAQVATATRISVQAAAMRRIACFIVSPC